MRLTRPTALVSVCVVALAGRAAWGYVEAAYPLGKLVAESTNIVVLRLESVDKTKNLLVQKDLVEKLAGLTLQDAVALAESNPLGMDEIFLRVRDPVVGRYYAARGNDMDGRILARECERVPYNPAELADLLNLAGGEVR